LVDFIAGDGEDPRRIIADSVKMGKPIITVALNYRPNIFGFGDGKETNLALKDQSIGVD
jgi:carboxylesterase type B